MPQIEITEAQREYLEDLRERLAETHVDTYGHVRPRDALQFLIDRHRADRDAARAVLEDVLAGRSYQQLQSLAADTEGVEPEGKAAELRERLVEALTRRIADEIQAVEKDPSDGSAPDSAGSAGTTAARGGSASEDTDGADADDAPADAEGSGGESRLQRMMGLLDRHDDVWEETDGDEGKYAVTLPDGSVRTVRTKDDVRAVLFQHYD